MRVTLGGCEVDLLTQDDLLGGIASRLDSAAERPLYVASANLDHVHHFGLDSGREGFFDPGIGGADWPVTLDGWPLLAAARRGTGAPWPLLAGSDLLPDLLRVAARTRSSVGWTTGGGRWPRPRRAPYGPARSRTCWSRCGR